MRHLAGLHRIQYVIAVPEEHDILLAGPAEGWKYKRVKGVMHINRGQGSGWETNHRYRP